MVEKVILGHGSKEWLVFRLVQRRGRVPYQWSDECMDIVYICGVT